MLRELGCLGDDESRDGLVKTPDSASIDSRCVEPVRHSLKSPGRDRRSGRSGLSFTAAALLDFTVSALNSDLS